MTSETWRLEAIDLTDLDRLAQRIALFIAPGDVIALRGPLGAGKTTFTRLLLRHLGSAEEVQSPTFGLMQTYPTARLNVHHCDFYRLQGTEAEELGLSDCLEDGSLVVEWPDRAASLPGADRLDIDFSETGAADRRTLDLHGFGRWAPRLKRLRALYHFLDETAYAHAGIVYMQGDASVRAYARLRQDGAHAILMNAPRMPDGPPIQDGKPYSQLVHLAEDVRPFVAVDEALRASGLSAPEIYAADLDEGFLLLEDLGDAVFGHAMTDASSQERLTRAAVDVLLHLSANPPPASLPVRSGEAYALPRFDPEAMLIEASLLADWLWPAVHGRPIPAAQREAYLAAWRPLLKQAAAADPGWVLRDYHSPNLIWLAQRRGIAQVGLLDFQDAMRGPLAYDLVSLLQDARFTMPQSLEAALLDYYCSSRHDADSAFSADAFKTTYALLGAQRNSKILGIFARLAKRDGKRSYLAHMPRVAHYLERDLAHPALGALKAWYAAELPEASALPPPSL